jgi:glyoxylase-like metal-dependent hydrolase (beta-lactamase superfamily II)
MNIDNLTCIDLDLKSMEGFRKFISAWLYKGDDFSFVVDPGPLSTVAELCRSIRAAGLERLDYILLTHIHIDHAGGTGALLAEFPEATVICHPDGIRHMIAPQKLWEGSRSVLGALAEAYGEIIAVPAEKIRFEETVGETGIKVYQTPGHAQHHCCYLFDDLLFAGEVAGVRSDVPGGIYMRPATPPRFILDVASGSIDKMIALSPRFMAFGHYGLVDNAMEHLQIARRQLQLWVKGVAITAGIEDGRREGALIKWLLEHDSNYANFSLLPADIQVRERYFFGNTMRGMSEFVDGLSDEERYRLIC